MVRDVRVFFSVRAESFLKQYLNLEWLSFFLDLMKFSDALFQPFPTDGLD
jgi:hypothetical protein